MIASVFRAGICCGPPAIVSKRPSNVNVEPTFLSRCESRGNCGPGVPRGGGILPPNAARLRGGKMPPLRSILTCRSHCHRFGTTTHRDRGSMRIDTGSCGPGSPSNWERPPTWSHDRETSADENRWISLEPIGSPSFSLAACQKMLQRVFP